MPHPSSIPHPFPDSCPLHDTRQVGGIRRIIVPVELGYPENNWRKGGPPPSTFAGQRALEFVLSNQVGILMAVVVLGSTSVR